MMRPPIVILVSLVAAFVAASSLADDTLLKAVTFALTGSDDAKVLVINRAECVFKKFTPTYRPTAATFQPKLFISTIFTLNELQSKAGCRKPRWEKPELLPWTCTEKAWFTDKLAKRVIRRVYPMKS